MEEQERELQRLLDEGNAVEAVRVMQAILAKGWVIKGRVRQPSSRSFPATRTEIALPVPPPSSLRFTESTVPFLGHVSPIPRSALGSQKPSGIGSRNPSFPNSEEQSSIHLSMSEEATKTMHP